MKLLRVFCLTNLLDEEEDYVEDEDFLHDNGTQDLKKSSQTLTTTPSSTSIPEMQLVGLCMSILVISRRVESKKLTEKAEETNETQITHTLPMKYSTNTTVPDEQHFLHIVSFSMLFILK